MKRSPTTESVKQLALDGKIDKEIASLLGLDLTSVRNRLNWLRKKGELPHAANKLSNLKMLASQMNVPDFYLRQVTRHVSSAEQGIPLLELWVKQGGACLLSGRNFEEKGTWSPTLVGATTDSPMLIAQAINRIRGTLAVPSFIELCKLVASRS